MESQGAVVVGPFNMVRSRIVRALFRQPESKSTANQNRQTRAIFTGDVYQDNFAQGAPPGWKKTAFYPLSVTIGHSQRFDALGPVAILRVNFTDQEPSASEPAHASKNR